MQFAQRAVPPTPRRRPKVINGGCIDKLVAACFDSIVGKSPMVMLFFKVVAKETLTSEKLQAVASVTVNVTDLNDNNPECSQAVYRETVSENRPGNTFVVQVRRMYDTAT